MKALRALRPILGVLLCVGGFLFARATAVRQTTVIVDASGCRMVTDVVDAGEDAAEGSVVLLHGLAANKKIMSYLAQAFAMQNLRVFVPDLPGHGRTPGPFSFARSRDCTETLVRQLISHGAIDPTSTILAGHSMGGAIAVLVAGRVHVAGVVAVSPAPMIPAHGIPAFMLPFSENPMTPPNMMAISGAWEPGGIHETAKDLITGDKTNTGKFVLLPHASHVSVLFDSRVARAAQDWSARVLHLPRDTPPVPLPSYLGWFSGFVGLLVLSGPFLRETVGPIYFTRPNAAKKRDEPCEPQAVIAEQGSGVPIFRALGEVAAASVLAVLVLRFWNPLQFVHMFQGDYFAAFLLLLGIVLLVLHRDQLPAALRSRWPTLVAAATAALMLHFLVMGWFELTITETWLIPPRWLRLPLLFLAVLPYHLSEEVLLGPSSARPAARRLTWALSFRLIAWGALVGAIFLLHSNQIFLVLLAVYFGLFCLLQRLGMAVVRKGTGSPLAAALFGAILLAGFCLVVFPIT